MSNQNPGIRIPAVGECSPGVRQAIQDIVRRLGTSSTPTVSTITLTSLTADRLVKTNSDGALASASIYDFVEGTTNQINKSDDGDGTMTLSTPQDIHTGASPTFSGMTLSGLTNNRLVSTNGSNVLSSTDLNSWVSGTANQVTVSDDADGRITLSLPQNIHTAASPTFDGLSSTDDITISLSQDSETGISVTNNNATTAASAAIKAIANGVSHGMLRTHGSSFTTSNQYIADGVVLESSSDAAGGLAISAAGDQDITWWVNGVKRAQLNGTNFQIGGFSSSIPLYVYHATINNMARFESGDTTCSFNCKDPNGIAYYGTKNGLAWLGMKAPGNVATINVNSSGEAAINKNSPVSGSILTLGTATEDLEIVDAGSVGATAQNWIKVKVGGVVGYLVVFATP